MKVSGATRARRNSPREWAIAILGGLMMAAALVWLLRGTQGPTMASDTAVVATIAPPATTSAQPVPGGAAVSAPGDLILAGLRTGPDGGMAIVATGGRQYLLRPGRSLGAAAIGGLRLLRVEPGRAILAGPGGEQVLAFPDAPRAVAGPSLPPGGDPTPWLLATTPQRSARGLDGWRLTSVAGLPLLASAGLRPGDILLSANGADLLSEEKVMELPQELAANGQLLLRVRRGGQVTEILVKL